MSLTDRVLRLRKSLLDLVEKLKFIAPTLARITVGVVFVGTGWGKLHNLDGVTEFFTSLHIPAPHAQAILVASTEFVGGLLLLLGLGTRLVAPPLAVTMVVAILTAKWDDVDSFKALLGLDEFLYLVLFVWLALAGAGPLSIDRLIARRLDAVMKKPLRRPEPAPAAAQIAK